MLNFENTAETYLYSQYLRMYSISIHILLEKNNYEFYIPIKNAWE